MAKKDNTNLVRCKKSNLHKRGNGYKLDLNFGDLGDKLDDAQYALDTQVWLDVQKYMPIDSGNLISQTNAINANVSKKVYMFPPNLDYGHYQHEGIVYVDPMTQKSAFYSDEYGFWSRAGVKKVPSDRKLKYSNPNATAHWGETAYKNHKNEWVEVVKRAIKK